jgi:hypothetical protein
VVGVRHGGLVASVRDEITYKVQGIFVSPLPVGTLPSVWRRSASIIGRQAIDRIDAMHHYPSLCPVNITTLVFADRSLMCNAA